MLTSFYNLFFCQVSLVTVGHALIFLGHTIAPVISGLQEKTVRLTLMNVAAATVAMNLTGNVIISMPPVSLVQTRTAKDLNVSAGMVSQVNRKLTSSFFTTHQLLIEKIKEKIKWLVVVVV